MKSISIDDTMTWKSESSDYDDTITPILHATITIWSGNRDPRKFDVRLTELADSLRGVFFKCMTQKGSFDEYLWDTGERVRMRRVSDCELGIELPVGMGEIQIPIDQFCTLLVKMYTLSISGIFQANKYKFFSQLE